MNFMADSAFRWTRVTIVDGGGHTAAEVGLREPFEAVIEAMVTRQVEDLELNFSLYSGAGVNMFNSTQTEAGLPTEFGEGPLAIRVAFDPNLLAPGQYTMGLWATGPAATDHIRLAAHFSVSPVDAAGGSLPANYAGIMVYPCRWTIDVNGQCLEAANPDAPWAGRGG